MQIAVLVAAFIGAVSTAVIGYTAFRLSRKAQLYAAQRAIGDLANATARFRAEHPEIMRCASRWTRADFAVLYGRADAPDADTIVRYYSYVDMGLEFCNTALAARERGVVPSDVFERHYRPLVRLFLAENYPYVSTALSGPYLSSYVRGEMEKATEGGWDWDVQHREIAE